MTYPNIGHIRDGVQRARGQDTGGNAKIAGAGAVGIFMRFDQNADRCTFLSGSRKDGHTKNQGDEGTSNELDHGASAGWMFEECTRI